MSRYAWITMGLAYIMAMCGWFSSHQEFVALKAHHAKMECIEVVEYQPTGVKR